MRNVTVWAVSLWLLAGCQPLGQTRPTPPPAVADNAPVATEPASDWPGLRVDGQGRLLRAGRPYRAVGVNYFSAYYRVLKDAKDTSYDQGFQELARAGVPFVRLAFSGFWPVDWKAYFQNKEEYFARLDAVVRSAERHGVGLIPSLFWNTATVSDLVGEPYSRWGDPNSQTLAFMRTYTREVVTRYRESPAVWAWEFGNEMNNEVDLPNRWEHRPPVQPALGTPATRTERDDLTYDEMRIAFLQFAQEVRRLDPHRPLSTGDSMPRAEAYHMRLENSFRPDTPAQEAQVLAAQNPGPIDLLSVHVYNKNWSRLALMADLARRLRKPLFVGEFGVAGDGPEARTEFTAALDTLDRLEVPLAAVWVFDSAKDRFNVTAANSRAFQLEMVQAANERLARAR